MKQLILVLLLAILACRSNSSTPSSIPTLIPAEFIPTAVAMTFEAQPTPTSPTSTVTVMPATSTSTPLPLLTSTAAPYEQYTIDYLRQRSYGGGIIEIVRTMEVLDQFTRTVIRYTSDDLTLYGFMNIPAGEGPFPVIIMMHGLGDSGSFNELNFKSDIVDALTMEGHIVIHPIMRGYSPSDSGDNMFRVGMAVDMLNLIALIKTQSGEAGALEKAMPEQIGLLGQSLGGNVALRVLTVSSDVQAAVLYSSLSGNEFKNSEQLYKVTVDPQFQNELNLLPSQLQNISPVYYYANITSPIQLHHGTMDETVPVNWAEETCSLLNTAGKSIECIYYEGEDHVFDGEIKTQFIENMIGFYKKYLSP